MKAIIQQPQLNARRIKFSIPFAAKEWRIQIKSIPSIFYHKPQKLWSLANTKENLGRLISIFGQSVEYKTVEVKASMPKVELTESMREEIRKVEEKIMLKAYSHSTLKAYRGALVYFFSFFGNRDLKELNKDEIEGYIGKLINKYKISETKQNTIINAIKFYYEQVSKSSTVL